MKKSMILMVVVMMLISVFSVSVYATEMKDGIYEVPVTLMHKEDEEESVGNKYIAHTALLSVEGGKKIVTIFLSTDMSGIEFSYYKDGSIEGDTEKATTVSNVMVAGETYETGFEIPVVKNGDIGLKFSVPVMPMSPSARLRIDYDNAVLISSKKSETVENETTQEVNQSVVIVTEVATKTTVNNEVTTVVNNPIETQVMINNGYVNNDVTEQIVTEAVAVEETTQEENSIFKTIIILVVSIWVVSFIVITISRKKKK